MTTKVIAIAATSCMMGTCSSGSREPREAAAPSRGVPATASQPAPPLAAEAPVQPAERTYRIPLAAGAAKTLVHTTSKKDEVVLLELFADKISFTALISRRAFEQVMTLKPPTYFHHEGLEYVRNDGMLFWGEVGNDESVSVDGKVYTGFVLVNPSQISTEGEAARTVLDAMRTGRRLKLEKHYWGSNNQKGYPSFALDSIRADLPHLSGSSGSTIIVRDSDTRCRQEGSRPVVWVESAAGSFALNGPAIDLVNTRRNSGDAWLDSKGRPVGIGRDVLGVTATMELIQPGLRKCEAQ